MTLQAIASLINEYIAECADTSYTLQTFPIIATGDFNSLAIKRTPDQFDSVTEFPDGFLVSGAYTLFSTGLCCCASLNRGIEQRRDWFVDAFLCVITQVRWM